MDTINQVFLSIQEKQCLWFCSKLRMMTHDILDIWSTHLNRLLFSTVMFFLVTVVERILTMTL